MTWRDIFIKRIGWKVFSLITAVFIWATFSNENNFFDWSGRLSSDLSNEDEGGTRDRDIFNFPVRIIAPAGHALNYQLRPAAVDLSFSGSYERIRSLRGSDDIMAYVDVEEMNDPNNSTNRVHVKYPPGITLQSVTPEHISIERLQDATVQEEMDPDDL